MFVQWKDAKRAYPDAVLFFRMGDFYELFFEDAQLAAPILELTLTTRGKGTHTEAPMCGVPHFAADGYVARLVDRGYRVAICEQVEDPRKTKGMVRRDVVRVVSPGVFTDTERMRPAEPVTLASCCGVGPFGVCFADLSTGSLRLSTAHDVRELVDLLARHETKELLIDEQQLAAARAWVQPLQPPILVTPLPSARFHLPSAAQRVLASLAVQSLNSFGCDREHQALPAAAAALEHLAATQKIQPRHLDRLSVDQPGKTLILDAGTRRNLELTANMRDGSRRATLLEVVDRTATPLGARLVRQWLLEPMVEPSAIDLRLDAVTELVQQATLRRDLIGWLGHVRDLERLLARAALGASSPRELVAMRASLAVLPAMREALASGQATRLRLLYERLDPIPGLAARLTLALAEEPGTAPGDGRVIREGFDPELDQARDLARGGKRVLAEIEAREKARTGIASLKIRYNKIFGYYLEVTRSQLEKVPDDYERRQTVAGAERYVTPELRELESRILSAEDQLSTRELELFRQLQTEVTAYASQIRETASAIAELDVLVGFADVAAAYGLTRPLVSADDRLMIEAGRHPVIEQLLPAGSFVPNDFRLDEDSRIVIVTGPNMGGKSTYLRQVALITLMAQIGSFVPARHAEIGVVDRIFCRVGASDNLAGGESTFMVEMTETANIVHNATSRSLVILDEIGRGTATWDGMAIAWAVVEHLQRLTPSSPKVLFATHYHELTELEGSLPGVINSHISVAEDGHEIVFLHRIVAGPSDRSYGIHVARLAGLPDRLILRAQEILARLIVTHPRPQAPDASSPALQLPLFQASQPNPCANELLEALRATSLDELTPRQALDLLYLWKARIDP
jgi:DNA mismatch repair protein MutS